MENLHIIPTSSRDLLIQSYLKKKDILLNHRFESFQQAFFPNQPDALIQFYHAYHHVLKHQSDFSLLKQALSYPQTTKQAIQFMELLNLYQIPLSTIQTTSLLNQEKLALLQLVEPFARYQKASIPSHFQVHPFYQQLYHQHYLPAYQPIQQHPRYTQYRHALNPRQEVSGILAYLQENSFEDTLILVPSQDYIQEFKRQQPTLIFLDETLRNTAAIIYYYLFSAILNHSNQQLITFLNHNPFKLPNIQVYLSILKQYQFSYDQLTQPLPDLNPEAPAGLNQAYQSHRQKYQLAQETHHLFLEKCHSLFLIKDKVDLYTECYHLLAPLFNSQESYQLKETLETYHTLFLDLYPESLEELLHLTYHPTQTTSGTIYVALNQTIPFKSFDCCIHCGLNQTTYPHFKALSGLFNEDFVLDIVDFPSLQARIDFHNQQLLYFTQCSHTLIYSYADMDYVGHIHEQSYTIQQLTQREASLWTPKEANGYPHFIHNLSPALSQQLFFNDNKELQASISSLEKLANFSYQYFIEHGLKVRAPRPFELDAAQTGTILHAILETLVKQEGKHYPQVDDLADYLAPYQAHLTHLFPHQTAHYTLFFYRLQHLISDVLTQLQEPEKHSFYQPSDQEKRFEKGTLFDDIPLYVTGIVDRVDEGKDSFIIYDYKSSEKTFSSSQFKNGLQLQLLTYAKILETILSKPCDGALYVPFVRKKESLKYPIIGKQKIKYPKNSRSPLLRGLDFKIRAPFDEYIHLTQPDQLSKPEAAIDYLHDLYAFLYETLSEGMITQFFNQDQFFDFSDLQRIKQSKLETTPLMNQLAQRKEQE